MPPRVGPDRPGQGAPHPSLEGAGVAPLRKGVPGAASGCVRSGRGDGTRTAFGPARPLETKPSHAMQRLIARQPARQRSRLVRSHPPSSYAPIRDARGIARAVVPWMFTDRGSAVAERSDRSGGRSDHSGPVLRGFGLAYASGLYQGSRDGSARRMARAHGSGTERGRGT